MRLFFTITLQILVFLTVFSQSPNWRSLDQQEKTLDASWSKIRKYNSASIDFTALRNYLVFKVPAENNQGKTANIELPMPDGSIQTFKIMESPIMESGLADRYPEIKTYKGSNGKDYMRMICTDQWMKAYILRSDGDIIIEPLSSNLNSQYGSYFSSDIILSEAASLSQCGENGKMLNILKPSDKKYGSDLLARTMLSPSPENFITYRIAVSCTGEFGAATSLGGGSTASALAKIMDALTYANGVFEKDLSIHLSLVSNNDRIIYLDPTTDPFDNTGSGGYLLGQNTAIVNARIGANQYDYGHVFNVGCSDVGGIANLGVICERESKANGVTCWYTTDVAYVSQRIFCHEMGHQFSASHTFSNCNGNESGTRYEPGSGTTIMSYSGLCGGLNIETSNLPHPNFYHTCSLEQIYFFTRNVATCGTKSDPNNNKPVANIITKQNLVLPIRTPFELVGQGFDSEDTTLTYGWEQYDNGPYGDVLGDVSTTGPLFRVFFPSNNPIRVIPQWTTLLNISTNPNNDVREYLPFESRDLNFRFVVRDNHPGAGAFSYAPLKLKVTDQAGPFKITFPNASTDRLFKNACNKIQWDVANTFNLPVNCKKVDIIMFKNREYNNPIILKSNTDNDGLELVDIPDLGTNVRVRVIVKAVDNIFFDISDREITIIDANSTGVNMGVTPNIVNVCLPQLADVKIKSCSFGGYKGNLNLFIENTLPAGVQYSFGKNTLTESDETTLKVDANTLTSKNTFEIIVAAVTPSGDTLRDKLIINAIKNDFSDQRLLSPGNGAVNVLETPVLRWQKSINSNVYRLEVATSPSFGTSIVYSQSGLFEDTLLLPVLLKESKIYYWRIIPTNDCGVGVESTIHAFQTVNKTCVNQAYAGNPVGLFTNTTHTIKVPINFSGKISDFNVNDVEIDADAVKDVNLFLESPSGKKVNLFNPASCGITLDFLCSFDDDAPIPLTCPPIGGKRMRPYEPLSNFNGESLLGDWKFLVVTKSTFRDGLVRNFTLQYCAELKPTNPISILNGPLRLNVGETKAISNQDLLAQDPDNSAQELVFTVVSIPSYGNLLLNGVVLSVGKTFTQKDIDDNKLSYIHTGNNPIIDEFSYTVNDGTGGWFGVSNFDIYVGPVAVEDYTRDRFLQLFPNPTTGRVDILLHDFLPGDATLYLMDIHGKSLKVIDMKNQLQKQLDLSELNNGIYFLNYRTKGNMYSRKLVIAK